MNTESTNNLISALNAAFTATDIIGNNADMTWDLDQLRDILINAIDEDDETILDFYAVPGSVYLIRHDGTINNTPEYTLASKA